MATTYKFVLTTWLDTTNASDGLQITPTFHDKLGGTELDSLAGDLLDAWDAYLGVPARGTQQRVTVYDIKGAKPNYPKYVETRFPDVAKTATQNRDVAMCLSAYADDNRPRQRGRLYIPMCLTGVTPAGATANITARQKIADLVPILESLGGVNIDWGVYSRVDQTFKKYTNWYVSNSWNTQRRRGKKADARQTGTTSA